MAPTKIKQEPLVVAVDDLEAKELTDLSTSRIGIANRCGLAFKYRYIDQLPDPYESGAQIFGHVIHDGVAEWYGMDPDEDHKQHQKRDLKPIILRRWQEILPEPLWDRLSTCIALENDAIAIAEMIRLTRSKIKNPFQTKQYLESTQFKELYEARTEMIEFCDSLETIKWPKDQDLLKSYRKSAEIADRLQERWQDKPRPLAVERPFRLELGNHIVIRGRLDQLRADPDREGEVHPELRDLKTGRNLLSQMEAFIQAWIYDTAIRELDDLPDPEMVSFDNVRLDKLQRGKVDVKRHRKLALRILNDVARRITMAQFEPQYGMWCSWCSYNDLCSAEISMWEPGTQGVVVLP